jgi:hypothetical protein
MIDVSHRPSLQMAFGQGSTRCAQPGANGPAAIQEDAGEPGQERPGPLPFSYSQGTTARLAAQAGGTFSRYAPGDHARPSRGRRPERGGQ